YNTWDSPLVTHANTSQALLDLNIGERTGPVVFLEEWSYVERAANMLCFMALNLGASGLWIVVEVEVEASTYLRVYCREQIHVSVSVSEIGSLICFPNQESSIM
ncbi:hypothetical protein K432DRAFT_450878, partial [Lepidopterella palustris CBS 459.81]